MKISLAKYKCDIVISSKDLSPFTGYLSKKPKAYSSCMIISDEKIFSLYGDTFIKMLEANEIPTHHIILKSGEQTKRLETASKCWEEMYAKGLDRKSLVVGLGGGVVTDLSGFLASCYMRGIDAIHIPTTLLAMVDAAIGGKTGVNLPGGKNIIGTIYHPKLVLISPTFLASLPRRELCAGIAEVIKYGVIWDAELFEFLEKHAEKILQLDSQKIEVIISKSCAIKAEVVRKDEKEENLRAILNFGHTVGHAIETSTHYSTYLHGEAIAIGMSCAAHISYKMGLIERSFIERLDNLCHLYHLPTALPDIPIDHLIKLMMGDKKSVNKKISLILVNKIGKVVQVNDVDTSIIREALNAKIEESNTGTAP